MNIKLIRHATLLINYNQAAIVIDPMLSPAGSMPPVPGTANAVPNPLVNLQVNVAELLAADAVLLTHKHRDHFDAAAAALFPKDIRFFCQPEDEEHTRGLGFTRVIPIQQSVEWNGISLIRTSGRHGTGDIGKAMGPVSGFVLSADSEPTLYIAGDTIWCEEVELALSVHNPHVTVVFSGAAQFLQGDPITMAARDVEQVCKALPETKVIACHMEAWNHCFLTRDELADFVRQRGLQDQVYIPKDGEVLGFPTKKG